jgi:hypothetical protein
MICGRLLHLADLATAFRSSAGVPLPVGGVEELPAIGLVVTGVLHPGDEDSSAGELTYRDTGKLSDESSGD